MAAINKVSDITAQLLVDRLRVESSSTMLDELGTLKNAAVSYISEYLGIPISSQTQTDITLDSYPEFVIAVYVLVQDMYDNGSFQIENKSNINKVIDSILSMHRVNLL